MMKILTVIGTRPDAIKLLPVHLALQAIGIESIVCSTAQHRSMLDQVLNLFEVTPSFDLQIMQEGQDLFHITQSVLAKIKPVLEEVKPTLVLVQGDTTTSFAAALAAFYKKIAVGHVEAGLRTGSLEAPYPEEMNRRFISMVGTYHFAATSLNVANLLSEGITRKNIVLTGNTVVDALFMIKQKIEAGALAINPKIIALVAKLKAEKRTLALLTAHRRESFDGGLLNIFNAVQTVVDSSPELVFLYPHHPNPHVLQAIRATNIAHNTSVELLPPLSYEELVYCMLASDWVATDSGGIQEEAVSLGKPVVILRDLTERIEGVWAGIAHLAGTKTNTIVKFMHQVHTQKERYSTTNIYGDGQASKKIASFIDTLNTGQPETIGLSDKPVGQQNPYINANP
jgi:UDP-N-acetylglucosamine 2-epimerase (non-hydrolysing)